MLRTGLLSYFVEFHSAVAMKKSKNVRGLGRHLWLPISPINIDLVENHDVLFHVKLWLIPFPDFKLKMSQPIRGQDGYLVFFSISPKQQFWCGHYFFSVKFRWVLFSGCREEVKNVSAGERPEQFSCFLDQPEKYKSVEDVKTLRLHKFHWILFSIFREKVENGSANQRPWRQSLCSDRPNKHNFVEDVAILLHIQLCLISFRDYREDVENVSAYQMPGRTWPISGRSNKHKFGRGCWHFASSKFMFNSLHSVHAIWSCVALATYLQVDMWYDGLHRQ